MMSRGRWGAQRTSALVAVVAILMGACERSAEESREPGPAGQPQAGGTAVVCLPSEATSLNPFVTNDQRARDLAPLLYTPLVRRDTAGNIGPYLARSWSWAEGRRRLTFTLRRDLIWHDSVPVTARDVAWTLETAARPEFGYPDASDFRALAGVTVVDSATLTVRFQEPFVAGIEPFLSLPILPRHLLEGREPKQFSSASYHREPVGSGPFRFVERRADGTLVFERFGPFPEDLGPVYLDRLLVRVIPSPRTMVTEFRVGGVDACVTTASGAAQLEKVQDLTIDPLRPAGVQYIALNTTVPPLDDARVRRALSAALNRSAIASIVSPLASPAGTPLSAESPYLEPKLTQPDNDSTLADSLLAAAGWTREDGNSVRRSADGEPLAFTLLAPAQLRDPLTVIQSQWEKVGVDVDLRFMEWTAYVGRIKNPDTRPAAMALGLGTESLRRPDYRAMFHSESPRNLSGYGSPRLDSLLALAATARDTQQLRRAYQGLQQVVRQEAPYLFTVYVPRGLAVGPRLRGAEPALNVPLATVDQWWIPAAQRRGN